MFQAPLAAHASGLVAIVMSVALLASACSGDDDDDDVATTEPGAPPRRRHRRRHRKIRLPPRSSGLADAEDGVTQSQEALTTAHGDFCDATEGYVETLDRYGRVFTDLRRRWATSRRSEPTSSHPPTPSPPPPTASSTAKDDLAAAQQELVDAQAALAAAIATASSVPNSTATPTTSTTTTLVPPATIERVQQAEDDLARVSQGITDETPLVEAAADYNSAALALEMAWLRLLDDAAVPDRRAAGQRGRADRGLHDRRCRPI